MCTKRERESCGILTKCVVTEYIFFSCTQIEEHKALMIHGAQGTGKTYLARALANHFKVKVMN